MAMGIHAAGHNAFRTTSAHRRIARAGAHATPQRHLVDRGLQALRKAED